MRSPALPFGIPRLVLLHTAALSAIASLATGCAVYHPKPLVAAVADIPSGETLHSLKVDLRNGVNPDEAAVLAVLLNPTLRADRDRHGLAVAQLIQAGVLPNPSVSFNRDYVIGGNTEGTISAFGLGGSWDVTSLLTLTPKLAAARANLHSIDLDIAWTEWQTAQAARIAVYRVISLEAQLSAAHEADFASGENVTSLQKAVELHNATALDLAAAQSASNDARMTALATGQELEKQRLELKRALGVPPGADVRVEAQAMPSHLDLPSEKNLVGELESRRLDLLALKSGYDSQDATLRAAILSQFPKISLGLNRATDTSNVQTLGFGVSIDLPIFDRNQVAVATENATRQKLFDEYTSRVFQARTDVAVALSDIRFLSRQIAASGNAITHLQNVVTMEKAAMDEGNADVLSYYQARNNLLSRKIELLKLKQQLVETRIALEIAAGRLLP